MMAGIELGEPSSSRSLTLKESIAKVGTWVRDFVSEYM